MNVQVVEFYNIWLTIAVHFTTILCEPNTDYKAQRKPNFYDVCPGAKDIEYPGFEDFTTFV